MDAIISPYDALIIGNTIYFICSENSCLFSVDIETLEVSVNADICINFDMPLQYGRILLDSGKLIFTPQESNSMCFYNLASQEVERIIIPGEYYNDKLPHFFAGIKYEEKLFLFGYSKCLILEYNCISKQFKNISIDYDICKKSNEGFFHVEYYREGDIVFFPFFNSNALLEFNLRSGNTRIHIIGNYDFGFISIKKINGKFYFVPRDGAVGGIVEWDYQTKQTTIYDHFPENFYREYYSFFRSVELDGKLLLFRHAGNMNILVDVCSGYMSQFEDLYSGFAETRGLYSNICCLENKYIFLSYNGMLEWDPWTNEKRFLEYKYTDDVIKKLNEVSRMRKNRGILSNSVSRNLALSERKDFQISDFVRLV